MAVQGTQRTALLARNSVFNLAGQVLPLLVGVAAIPYIVRGLGTTGFGILSIALMLMGYFSTLDFGLGRATVKFAAECLAPEKIHELPALVWTSLVLQLLIGILGAALTACLVPLAVDHLFKVPLAWRGEARTSFFILCAALPVLLCNNALRGVLQVAQRFDLINLVRVPASISFYVLALVAIELRVKVSGIVLLLLSIRCISTTAYFILCLRVFPQLGKRIVFSKDVLRPLASFGGWIMVSNIAGPVFTYAERFTIAAVLSVSMLSFYAAPLELVGKILIFPSSVAPTLFPFFSYHGTKGGAVVSEVTSRALKYLLFVMSPVTALFVFFAKDILRVWLGQAFADQSTVVLQLLALTFFLNAFAYVPYTSVQALGRPDLKAVLDMASLPIFVGSAWWLTLHLGINGAALAKLLISVVDAAFLFGFARKLRAFRIRDCASGPLFRTVLASAGLILAVFLIACFHPALPAATLLVTACFACYTAAFWLVAVDGRDRFTIRRLPRQLFARR